MKIRELIAIVIVGLYAIVLLSILCWSLFGDGDPGMFFEYMGKANFLLGPVGFVLGYYFKVEAQQEITQ